MEIAIVSLVAFVAAILTFFSGFGLGTLLTPVLVLFFPIDLAIALTGIVHFLNNLFKLGLVGRATIKNVLLKFGIPSILAAFIGAWILIQITDLQPLYSYTLWGKDYEITPIKFFVSILLIFFAVAEYMPLFERLQLKEKHLPLGGILSGFFGGLSGHQGALRSAFLIKANLTKESFIATSVSIACLVDFSRLSIYASRYGQAGIEDNLVLLVSASVCAFAGAYIGNRFLKKITLKVVQQWVTAMLIIISIALGAGLI